MLTKRNLIAIIAQMGCGGCFGFSLARKPKPKIFGTNIPMGNHTSRGLLWREDPEDDVDDNCSYNGDATNTGSGDEGELQSPAKRSEEIILYRTRNGWICREFPVRETHRVVRSEVRVTSVMTVRVKLEND